MVVSCEPAGVCSNMPLAKHPGGLIVRVVPMQADDLPAVAALSGELGYDVTLAAAVDRFA